MTEPNDLSPADLEAVSAHLDGEATAEEAARIEADPALRGQVHRMALVRDRLAVDDPPAPAANDRIARALDAFDAGPATAPVVDLAAARERRWYHRVPLGAVAAALLVVAAIGAITQIDVDGDSDEAATAADSGDDSAEGAAEDSSEQTMLADDAGGSGSGDLDTGDGSEGAGAGAGAATEAASAPLEFATVDDLAAHLTGDVLAERDNQSRTGEGEDEVAAPDTSAGFEALEGCDPVAAADLEGAPLLAVLPALVDGRAVTAVVVDDPGGPRLVVVDDETCAVADDRSLAG